MRTPTIKATIERRILVNYRVDPDALAFPGWQHRALVRVEEGGGSYRIDVSSHDGDVHIGVAAHRASTVMADSVFGSVDHASRFFRCAPVGYATTRKAGFFDGVALAAEGWAIEPLHLDEVRSSFFDNPDRFAAGTATPDSAFLMAGLHTSWRAQPALVASQDRV